MSTEYQESSSTCSRLVSILLQNYGDIRRAGFRVRGHLKNDFFATIHRKIQTGIRKFSQAGTKAIDKAKEKVNRQKVKFDRAIQKLKSAEKRVNKARRAFDRAKKKLRSWEKKYESCVKLSAVVKVSCIILQIFSYNLYLFQFALDV